MIDIFQYLLTDGAFSRCTCPGPNTRPKLNITSEMTFLKRAKFQFQSRRTDHLKGQYWSLYLRSEVMKFFFDLGFELMLKQIISIGFCSSSAHEFVLEQTRTKKHSLGNQKKL